MPFIYKSQLPNKVAATLLFIHFSTFLRLLVVCPFGWTTDKSERLVYEQYAPISQLAEGLICNQDVGWVQVPLGAPLN